MNAGAPNSTRSQSPGTFDLIVIGSGPGGQRAALQGAKAGKKVAIIEEFPAVGGGCVHQGTLPSKSFRESVYRYSLGSRGTLGQEAEHHAGVSKKAQLPQMSRLLRRRDRVVAGETQVIYDQLKRNNIRVFHGHGRLVSAHEVEITRGRERQVLRGEIIFIAVGARPICPPHLPGDGKLILDSNTILNLKRLPKSMVVLGAGIIGCEYASMFSMAGTRVYLVDRRPEILASVDREIVGRLVERFETQGMEIILNSEAEKVEKRKGGGVRVHLSGGRKINADVVLVALGRAGNTDGLGLDHIGVERDERGLIKVDQYFRSSIRHIYAVGDVIGAPALASTSIEQGRVACCHAFGISVGQSLATDPSHADEMEDQCAFGMPAVIPYGIYTIPEISTIGKTEGELQAADAEFVVGRAPYRELARGQIVGDRWGLLKLLVDRKTLRLLGVHIIGDNAADLIHIGQAVMEFRGDVRYFINAVFNYPTLAEAYKTAAFHAINQIRGTTSRK